MNTKKIILGITISLLIASSGLAQKKIGIFVHGFNGASEKWLVESEAPQLWKSNGTITDYVALDYETLELETPQSQALLLARFDQILKTKGSKTNDEWIIIGHSLGGIVGRALYPSLRGLGYNVVAVVSIAGPSQGAEATNVDKALISSTIDRMQDKINAAQQHVAPTVSFFLGWQNFLTLFGAGSSTKSQIAAIPEYLEAARDTALGYADTIIESKAASLIGRNGLVINQINGYSLSNQNLHPQNYLAIAGAEKSKIPFRMIGHIFEDETYKDEYKTLNKVNDLRNKYFSTNEGYYRQLADRYHWCRFRASCRNSRDYAHYRENLWKQAKLEIDNIDATWGELINSYKFTTVSYQEYVPPCEDTGGRGGLPGFFQINATIFGGECSDNPSGEYRTITTEYKTADKNDGVVNINSVLWSSNSSFGDLHNKYFDDVPTDGGYNHFELRNYKRAYKLPGVFEKDAKNPSLGRAEAWVDNLDN